MEIISQSFYFQAVSMQQKIGFPDNIFDDEELEKMYNGVGR